MVRLHNEIALGVSAAQAWAVVGDLAGVGQWIQGIVSCRIYGATRVCTFEGGAVQHEQISDYSAVGRSYRYTIEGGPLPVANNRGRLAVEPDGAGARIVWDAEFEVMGPAPEADVAAMVDAAYKETLEALRRRLG